MKDKLTAEQTEVILKALNTAIENGPWDQSNFLKIVGKNLTEIRENFLKQLGTLSYAQLKAESHLANRMALRSGQQEIYVSLYSTEGANLQSWEKILLNLPRHIISRPIYADEADIKSLLKLKEHKQNEAYVAIYVNQADILAIASDKVALDKLGKPLLILKDKTINLDNISRFVHLSNVYKYEKNRLIKTS